MFICYVIDISFNSILNNNAEKQLPSTSCKFQEIKTNNVKNLCFAQENDTEIQEKDTESDSDYVQSEYSSAASDSEKIEKSEQEDDIKKHFSNTQNNDSTISTGMDVSNIEGCETRQDEQTVIPTKFAGTKKYMCVFCHKMQAKIARHFELVHSKEPDVQKFKYLPKSCSETRKIIDTLRKRGNFKFNIEKQYEGQGFIPCRRARENQSKILKNYLACGNCKGHYLKSTLRHHFKKCTGRTGEKSRIVKVMGRRIEGKCLKEADERVRRLVLPVMRNDDVTRNIRYDSLLLLYANSQCKKYRHSSHHLQMIRARLRLVNRLLIAMRNINNDVTSLTSIYDPKYYDTFLDAINIVAQYDKEKDTYEKPAVASNLDTYVKYIGELLITKCIKEHDDNTKTNTKNFLKLLTVDYGASVNKTVVESQTQFRRQKITKLPTMKDIQKLRNHLLKVQKESYNNLKNKFLLSDWISLGEATLTSIQLFNRRRPGETERILISDFKNYERINENIDTFIGMCTNVFTVKRSKAKVHLKNPYLFGIPGHDKIIDKHLRAYRVMLRFAKESKTEFPDTLRGTTLRKHIATMGITLNLTDNQITDLVNFMGHHEKIHKEVYRKPVIIKDITEVSQLLEAAQGVRDAANNLIDESDSEAESDKNIEIKENEIFKDSLQQSSDNSMYKKRTKTETRTVQKKRRSEDAFVTPVKRATWTQEEKRIVLETFEKQLQTDTLITGKEMQNLISSTPCLAKRTVPQMRVWLHTQKKKLNF
ncbi:uncharacterized protein [Linepithema humile]|uniref:uncharacterized protein n=1 Tax=Linepithema humile TaxID=83485 RepID=UPI00351E564D